jgi:hypothetical protein
MMVERSHEMTQKPLRDTFFSLKNASQRPVSVTTEFMETDWEMDEELSEVHSEFEEDGEPSPRGSFHSANSVSPRCVSPRQHSMVAWRGVAVAGTGLILGFVTVVWAAQHYHSVLV